MRPFALLALALALLLGGCKKTAGTTTAPSSPFVADLIVDVNLRSHSAQARLVTPDQTCIELGTGAKATLAGQPLTLKSRGGSHTGTYGHGSKPETITDCVDPVFELADTKPLEANAMVAFDLEDGSRAVHAVFDNLFATRAFKLDKEEGSTLKVGDKAHFIWTPATDKISSISLDRGKPITPPEMRVKVDPTPTPGTYELVVPPAWAGEGEAKVRMNLTIVPGTSRCDGVKSCNGVITQTLEGYRIKVSP